MSQSSVSKGTSRYLLPDENLAIETRRHWMILMRPFLKSMVIIAVALFLLTSDPYSMTLRNIVTLAIVAVLLYLGYQVTQWWLDHFIVTNRRVLLVSGVLTKRTAIMPLLKVTDMTYKQTPLARMLRYGTFVFESAGQDQALSRVDYLPGGPRQLYIQISALLFANYGGPTMPAPVPTADARPYPEQQTVDIRSGRDVGGVRHPRIHQTTPIPRSDDPYAPGREGDD
ncbi:MAG: PH domain-containing protein [Actinomycetota bacterium]|nr:PH domain-containing protein [Actinomycetota bacterium]